MPCTVLTGLLLSAVLALSACSSGGDASTSDGSSVASETSTSQSSTPAPSSSAPASSSTAVQSSGAGQGSDVSAAGSKPVAVGKTVVDPLLGDKAVVVKYVPSYAASAAAKDKYSTIADGKVLLVQVTVTSGTKYYSSVGESSFRVVGQPGTQLATSATSIIADELTRAGFTPLEDASTGKSSTGWMAFIVAKDFTPRAVRFERLAARGSDGKDIPAKNFDVAL